MKKKIYVPALKVRFPKFRSHVVLSSMYEENEEVANVYLVRLSDMYKQWGYEVLKSKVCSIVIDL